MAGKGENMTSESRLTAAAKQAKALELRTQGKTLDYIARTVGYASTSGAYKAIISGLQRTLQEPADELRKLELERLDIMQEAIWWAASHGQPQAVDRALRIMERRAKYMGLDAPIQYKQVFEDEVARIAEQSGVSPEAVWADINNAVSGKKVAP